MDLGGFVLACKDAPVCVHLLRGYTHGGVQTTLHIDTSTVLGKVDRQFKAGMQDPVIILCETSHR